MAQWPPTPVSPIPASGVSWPTRAEVGPLTLLGPTGENQQPTALATRTETLRGILNTLVSINNVLRDFFLDRDGADPAVAGSLQGPVYMQGDLDMGGFKVVKLADATAVRDAITVQQLESVQFSAEDDVEQVLTDRVVFQDGSSTMNAILDMDENRIIALGAAAIATDANRKDYVDTAIAALQASRLKRVGTPPMTGDLNFDGPLPADPGFRPVNVGDPTAGSHLVNLRYLNERVAITGADDVPTAVVLPYAGPASGIPANFLLCDGREVSRFTYQNLFNTIGIAYGPPSSSSVFKLPDLRGRVVVGRDNMGGQSADVLTGSFADALGGKGGLGYHFLTVAQLPAHTHAYADIYYAGGGAGAEQGDTGASDANNQFGETVRLTQSEGGATSHNTVQPSLVFNWLIRT